MTRALNPRIAVAADLPAIVSLVNSAYRGDSSRAGWTTEADLVGGQRIDADRLEAAIACSDTVVLVHEEPSGLQACVHLQRTGDGCYLGMLTVNPTGQGHGVGSRMLEAAERWAAEHWGSTYVHMTVIAQRTDLVPWYERRGYQRTGERRPFPYDDPRFGLPLRADLAFEVLRKPI